MWAEWGSYRFCRAVSVPSSVGSVPVRDWSRTSLYPHPPEVSAPDCAVVRKKICPGEGSAVGWAYRVVQLAGVLMQV